MGEQKGTFSEVEIIIGTFIFLVIELLLFLGIGLFLKPASVFVIEWWIWTKGGGWGTFDAKRVLKYAGNVFPLATLTTFLISAYMHNHPEKFGALQKIGKMKMKSLKGIKQAA